MGHILQRSLKKQDSDCKALYTSPMTLMTHDDFPEAFSNHEISTTSPLEQLPGQDRRADWLLLDMRR
jgi:hypothetical protein